MAHRSTTTEFSSGQHPCDEKFFVCSSHQPFVFAVLCWLEHCCRPWSILRWHLPVVALTTTPVQSGISLEIVLLASSSQSSPAIGSCYRLRPFDLAGQARHTDVNFAVFEIAHQCVLTSLGNVNFAVFEIAHSRCRPRLDQSRRPRPVHNGDPQGGAQRCSWLGAPGSSPDDDECHRMPQSPCRIVVLRPGHRSY